jgi:hypothetical protein
MVISSSTMVSYQSLTHSLMPKMTKQEKAEHFSSQQLVVLVRPTF